MWEVEGEALFSWWDEVWDRSAENTEVDAEWRLVGRGASSERALREMLEGTSQGQVDAEVLAKFGIYEYIVVQKSKI